MVSECLEELEVRCKFGVKCAVTCQAFGVLGSEFVELDDGCPVKMQLKDIHSYKKREGKMREQKRESEGISGEVGEEKRE